MVSSGLLDPMQLAVVIMKPTILLPISNKIDVNILVKTGNVDQFADCCSLILVNKCRRRCDRLAAIRKLGDAIMANNYLTYLTKILLIPETRYEM